MSSVTEFELVGDVTSNKILFDGNGGGLSQFVTQLGVDLIESKTEATHIDDDDQLLLQTVASPSDSTALGVPTGSTILKRIKKKQVVASFPSTPAGTVVTFAGSVAPYGWLLCYGQQISRARYPTLFGVIGTTYTPPGVSSSNFCLPDMRGKFPLGNDAMGGTAANSVTGAYARTLGGTGGSEDIELTENNIPQHSHDLADASKTYYAITDVGSSEPHIEVGASTPTSKTRLFISNTTGNNSGNDIEYVNSMNPSLTLNYIIYTGDS